MILLTRCQQRLRMAAVRSRHGRCADLESCLLSGERWIYVNQQSLLTIGEELSRPADGGGGIQSVTAPQGRPDGWGELGQLVERVVT